ncbi:DUF4405 domain-containing protein [Chlorobium sp.]|uniref:DUF4405 domain-containing protein n=1 Tax=Chlorobium sp. TaxID=1095 RepID=UPI0025BB6B1F|nr:DUF4405 domain-containing protein [Chlorobium sp.]
MSTSMKSWATPLAIGSFIILAVTGLLMFFKIEGGYIKPVHEWLSWLMVAGVVLHTVANWKAFLSYFSKIPAVSIISVGIVVTALAVFMPASREGGNPKMKMMKAIESARLETVAELAGKESEEIVTTLEKKGISVSDPSMTIRQIAKQNQKKEMEVLGLVFR